MTAADHEKIIRDGLGYGPARKTDAAYAALDALRSEHAAELARLREEWAAMLRQRDRAIRERDAARAEADRLRAVYEDAREKELREHGPGCRCNRATTLAALARRLETQP